MKKLGNLWIPTVTDTEILGFFGQYRWLSNFWTCKVTVDDIIYTSSEAAYMAGKTGDCDLKLQISKLAPAEAKRFARTLYLRPDWEDVKFDHMKRCLQAKFTQNSELGEKLKETGNKYLEETNYWNDKIWGVCRGSGQNNLGKLLMEVRQELG